jgi:hypothetical protein
MKTGAVGCRQLPTRLLFCLACISALPIQIHAQQGANAVWLTSNSPTSSYAFVDASQFNVGADICAKINSALVFVQSNSNLFPDGAVIDARGIIPASTQNCLASPFPSNSPPSTILLPASIIVISAPWTLPNHTRIVGEQPAPGMGQVVAPTLRAGSSFSGGSDMIDMGSSILCSSPCSGISVEHLTLDAGPATTPVHGIHNNFAQEQSYVNDVNLINMSLRGLWVDTGATDSGPYSNIIFRASGACDGIGSGSNCPACVLIQAQTRGLHGISCIGDTHTQPPSAPQHAGIYVDASNNSIADVHIESFWDGIEIGENNSTVAGVTVANIDGGISTSIIQNLVHICGSQAIGTECPNPGNVSDVTILQATLQNGNTTIEDDVTKTVIAPASTGPTQSVGVYALGAAMAGTSGYSRLTSSPIDPTSNPTNTVVPTWGVGSMTPPSGCSKPGALYSNTQGGFGTSVYVCTNSVWQHIP